MVKVRVLPNQNVELYLNGRLVREFETGEDPRSARALLARINQLKGSDGNPIYANYRWGPFFLWGLHQEELFNAYCRPFAAYRPLLAYLEANGLRVGECEDNILSSLGDLLRAWGAVGISEFSIPARIRNFLIFYLKKSVHTILSEVTLLARPTAPRVGIFSYDTVWGEGQIDRRLKDVYAHLERGRIGFLEIFPALTPSSLRNIWKRRRMALYYPVPQKRKPARTVSYDLGSLDPLEQKFFRAVLPVMERRMDEDCQIIPRLKRLLARAGISRFFSIDDSWTTTPLIVACRELGVELYGMQHGYMGKYHPGHMQDDLPRSFTLGFPKILVWGESSKEVILRHSHAYEAENLVVAGYIRTIPKQLPAATRAHGKFRILYPFEFLANVKEIARYIEVFLDKGYQVAFKVRWDTPLDLQLAGLPGEKLELVYDLDQSALSSFDVCAGTSTSFLHEMYYIGVPVWYLETRTDYLDSIVNQGFGTSISLEMLRRDDFDPYAHIKVPHDRERVYADKNFFDWIRP